MMSPYTSQPVDAYMAAQTSAGLVLGALLWSRRMGSRTSTALFSFAIALVVVSRASGEFLTGVGMPASPLHAQNVLKLALAFASVATLLTRRWRLAALALLGEAVLWKVTNYIQDSEGEVAAAHLAFLGLLIGVHWRMLPPDTPPPPVPERPDLRWPVWVDDAAAFALATVLGILTCRLLMHGGTDSADEWGYTFQAALFAKLHAYGSIPRCVEAFDSYWVFAHLGRRFAQYTPGWPLFMAPFVALRIPWLAGPVSFGLLAAGVSRMTRRAAAGFSAGTTPPSAAEVRAASRFAVLAMVLSSTMLINGGSRFPHVFVAAMFAWALEALFTIASDDPSPRDQWRWGATMGGCAALMLSARPGDGATLGLGLFVYFVYALVRRRIGWRAVVVAGALFGVISAGTLVILRLELGTWFTTGYSLAPAIRAWAKPAYSLPKPNEFKWAIPLATGAYCWWPCSPAVGLVGIAALRGRAQRFSFVFFLGYVPLLTLYTMLEFGRGWDFGYGPRYAFVFFVPMAIGTGIAFTALWSHARARAAGTSAIQAASPLAVAALAALLGVVRVAPYVYPYTYADVHAHNRLHDALEREPLHKALVVAGPTVSNTDPLDLTENLPLDLYPSQDVFIAIDGSPDTLRCLHQYYRDRTLYRAIPGDPVRIVPFR
jgi:hypothetical protein